MVVCHNAPRLLFYSFLRFQEREGGGNVVYTLVFNLWLFTDFRWGLGQGHGEEVDAAAADAGGAQARARSSLNINI